MTTKRKKNILIISVVLLILISTGIFFGYKYYLKIYSPNVDENGFLYIKTNSTFDDVLDSLSNNHFLRDTGSFKFVCNFKKYKVIKPGKYKLSKGMSNNSLINMLRSGRQTPVKLTFNSIRTKEQFAGKISKYIEPDSLEFNMLLNDTGFIKKYGFNKKTVISNFIPNTYELYWNISPKKLFEKMNNEYKKFWNKKRIEKAKRIGLTPQKVTILASIVQAEQERFNTEKPKIAGLYINRLKRKMPLESDPTLIFALNDFTKKRVLLADKEVKSPYNTYKNIGLPPGPINMPEISSIDAVLNYEKHNYIFMCAKEDLSGFHNFSKNNRQHEIYAARYHAALNKLKIYK